MELALFCEWKKNNSKQITYICVDVYICFYVLYEIRKRNYGIICDIFHCSCKAVARIQQQKVYAL